jgi:hypothetical protein
MATVRIRIDDFEDGVLPAICAATGAPADRNYEVRATSRASGWVWLALLAGPGGILVALLFSGVFRKSTSGYLPYLDAYQDRMRSRIRIAAVGAGAGVAAALGGFALLGGTWGGLGLLFFVGGLLAASLGAFFWFNPPGSVGATLDSTVRWVELDNASPAFVRAYEGQEAHRRAARRAEAQHRDSDFV